MTDTTEDIPTITAISPEGEPITMDAASLAELLSRVHLITVMLQRDSDADWDGPFDSGYFLGMVHAVNFITTGETPELPA